MILFHVIFFCVNDSVIFLFWSTVCTVSTPSSKICKLLILIVEHVVKHGSTQKCSKATTESLNEGDALLLLSFVFFVVSGTATNRTRSKRGDRLVKELLYALSFCSFYEFYATRDVGCGRDLLVESVRAVIVMNCIRVNQTQTTFGAS